MKTVKSVPIGQLNFDFIPSTIYKYRDWSDTYHKKMISERQLYFSHPKEFKNLKDCEVPVNFDFSYKKIRLKFLEEKDNLGLDLKSLESGATQLYNERFSSSKKRRQRKLEFYKSMNDRLGIFSAARKSTMINMWNNYANYFNGFCVEFDYRSVALELGEKYGIGASDINYQDQLPMLLDPFSWEGETYESFIFQYVNNKESRWFDEDEFRLFIIYYDGVYDKVSVSDRQIISPHRAFKSIIFGHNLSKQSRDEIIKAATYANLNVQFKETSVIEGQVIIKDL